MTHSDELWDAIQRTLSSDRWMALRDLYRGVEKRVSLDDEDHLPQAPGSDVPKWMRNVRNVLQQRKALGHVLWNGSAQYRLPSHRSAA